MGAKHVSFSVRGQLRVGTVRAIIRKSGGRWMRNPPPTSLVRSMSHGYICPLDTFSPYTIAQIRQTPCTCGRDGFEGLTSFESPCYQPRTQTRAASIQDCVVLEWVF